MIKRNILDSLKGQEIKEMIVNGKIALDDLDTAALEKLLDYETDMLCINEGDMELIRACADRLDKLNGPLMSEEEFRAAISNAENERVSAEDKTPPANTPVNAPAEEVNRRYFPKRIWIIAAAIALLAAAATVTASAFGFNVFEYFGEVIGLSAGASVEKGGVTLVNNGKAEKYASVSELLSSENINIMYPAVLPDGVVLEEVYVSKGENGGDIIEYIMNNSSTYISVDTDFVSSEMIGYKEQIIINECTYYVFCDENFAVCYYKDCYYYISSDSYENLILIINNMRENK